MVTHRLDADAAARVASLGDIPPMRQRGLAAVRAGLESAPLPDAMPEMADTIFTGDPEDRDHWLLKNGAEVIARHHTDESRFLVHWSAEVFADFDELKKNMVASDDGAFITGTEIRIDGGAHA